MWILEGYNSVHKSQHLGTWSWGGFPFPLLDSLYLTICVNNMVFAEHLLCFWGSGILAHARQRVLIGPVPTKALRPYDLECLMACLGRQHFTWVVTRHCWGNQTHPCVTPLGKDSWKSESHFLHALSHAPFPFADFILSFGSNTKSNN